MKNCPTSVIYLVFFCNVLGTVIFLAVLLSLEDAQHLSTLKSEKLRKTGLNDKVV